MTEAEEDEAGITANTTNSRAITHALAGKPLLGVVCCAGDSEHDAHITIAFLDGARLHIEVHNDSLALLMFLNDNEMDYHGTHGGIH